MAYINNAKFHELRKAAADGNEKAINILSIFRKGGNREELDELIKDYDTPELNTEINPSESDIELGEAGEPEENKTIYSQLGELSQKLQALVDQYGKKTVLVALNMLKADIESKKDVENTL